jgi:hypothetical protein
MIHIRENYWVKAAAACAVFACVMSAYVVAAPKKAKPKPPATSIKVDSTGLKPDSNKRFQIYKGNRCVSVAYTGRPKGVAPGKYDVRVGFPSGWVSRPLEIRAGQKALVPTGLFGFRNVGGAPGGSMVPQKLYQGETYLASGYHGMTARLYPGKYNVRYHLPSDVNPAQSLSKWHLIGHFPVKLAEGFADEEGLSARATGEIQSD